MGDSVQIWLVWVEIKFDEWAILDSAHTTRISAECACKAAEKCGFSVRIESIKTSPPKMR